jgi:protein TonB
VPVVIAPSIVPPSVLTGLRLSGDTQIVPSDPVKTAMLRDGKARTVGSFKVCLSPTGAIASVSIAGSTKYADYDAKIVSAIRAWTYQPYRVNGVPAPACSMVTFVYTIR